MSLPGRTKGACCDLCGTIPGPTFDRQKASLEFKAMLALYATRRNLRLTGLDVDASLTNTIYHMVILPGLRQNLTQSHSKQTSFQA